MRMARTAAWALAAAALVAAGPARAQTAVGVRVFGGYDTFAMGDAADIRRVLFVPSSEFSTPKDGYALGVGAELAWRPSLSFTLSYERLTPGRMSEVNGQKMRLPCNALLFEAEYRRRLRPRFMIGAAGGGGYYQLGEEIESPGTDRDLEGDAFGGQAFAIGEWEVTPAASVGLDIGYRAAKVSVDKVNRQPPLTDVEVDYSGLITRLVLRYLPRRTR
jgi:hypothetical protein